MRIRLTSIPVNDQQKALDFYTEKLGFVKKTDIPMGEYRWLTVESPEGDSEVELLLEPLGFAPAKTYQEALYSAGIPHASFSVENMDAEIDRLEKAGVTIQTRPQTIGPVIMAVIDDTCGNLIQLVQS